MSISGYEKAVLNRRSDPAQAEFVRWCYLDEPLDAAKRFAASEEFAEVRRILSLHTSADGCRVLDVGAGNGIASFAFASIGCDVVSLEPDPSPIVGMGAIAALTSCIPKGSISIVSAPAEYMQDDGSRFDIVYLRQVAHHFPVLEEGLLMCAQHLKPGGKFLMTREHVADTPQDVCTFKAQHPGTRYGILEQAYSAKYYRRAMRAAGLRNIREWGPFDSVINYYPQTSQQVKLSSQKWMRQRWGWPGESLCRRVPSVERMVCRRMSATCRIPGRLYSFFGVKARHPTACFNGK